MRRALLRFPILGPGLRRIRAATPPWAVVVTVAVALALCSLLLATRPGGPLDRDDLQPVVAALLHWVLPAAAVAAARIADVTIGVMRTVLTVAGRRLGAGVAAACEALVWISVASAVLSDTTAPKIAGYCLGVGVGTMLGISIVRAAQWGTVTIRVFVDSDRGQDLAQELRGHGLGVTVFTGTGKDGARDMVMSIAPRREAGKIAAELSGRDGVFCCIDSVAVIGTVSGATGRA